MKREMKRLLIVIYIFSVLALTASCNFFDVIPMPDVKDYSNNSNEISNESPRKGGTLSIATVKYDTLNPLKTKNFYMDEILGLVYDGLVYLDNNMHYKPLLAEEITSSADGKEWKIHLKENIKWHNGMYFSALDVEYTLNYLLNDVDGNYYNCIDNVESFDIDGAYTVNIKCKKPDSFFADKLYFPIVPNNLIIDTNPVGTGFYKFTSISASNMLLSSFEDNAEQFGKNKPNILAVRVDFYEDKNKVMFSDSDIVMIKYEDYSKVEGKIGYSVKKYVSTEFVALALNTSKNILANSSVRRALAYGIDRKTAVNDISYSRTVLSDLPIFPELWISPFNKLTYSYDINKAIELLKVNPGMEYTLNCIVNKSSPENLKYAEAFKESLSGAGVSLNVIECEAEEFNLKMEGKDFDMALININIADIDDLKLFFGTNGEYNITGYSNAELDALLLKLEEDIGDVERSKIYNDVEKIILADLPYIGLFYKQNFIFYKDKKIIGIEESKPNYIEKLNNIQEWYISGKWED